MNSKGMSISINIIFAIFIVMFVFFMLFNTSTQRAKTLIQKENFEYYSFINKYMLSVLSNPHCYNYVGRTGQIETVKQGLIDIERLRNETALNKDIFCVDNTRFIPSIKVIDKRTGDVWDLGVKRTRRFPWAEREITASLPVALFYNFSNINGGEFIFTALLGEIPSFYGSVKKSCIFRDSVNVRLNNQYRIKFDSTLNLMEISDDSFYPYFSCDVEDFEIEPGNHLVHIKYFENTDTVKVIL